VRGNATPGGAKPYSALPSASGFRALPQSHSSSSTVLAGAPTYRSTALQRAHVATAGLGAAFSNPSAPHTPIPSTTTCVTTPAP
jgi:hypothetical protein